MASALSTANFHALQAPPSKQRSCVTFTLSQYQQDSICHKCEGLHTTHSSKRLRYTDLDQMVVDLYASGPFQMYLVAIRFTCGSLRSGTVTTFNGSWEFRALTTVSHRLPPRQQTKGVPTLAMLYCQHGPVLCAISSKHCHQSTHRGAE